MNPRLSHLYQDIVQKKHHAFRTETVPEMAEEFRCRGLSPVKRSAERLVRVLAAEKPVILENEKIVLQRTVSVLPPLFTEEEWVGIKSRHFIHELGNVCNLCPDYAQILRTGLEKQKEEVLKNLEQCIREENTTGREFLEALLLEMEAVQAFSDRYRLEAERTGNTEVAEILGHIPRHGARTFHEALQFFRLLHFTLWCEGEYHITIGRFDQYMFPYLAADLEAGRLDPERAFELLEEFFLSFNRDSDLYPGVQQGDNGQSLVLGGVDGEGRDAFNLLSRMCLLASRELKLIDPKINLRVHPGTPLDVYELGTQLTREGLGFPQYSNDAVVIPGLLEKGYSLQDARNYVVAACWEFIVPGSGMDIPNIGALSFPKVVDTCLRQKLEACDSFETFLASVETGIAEECGRIAGGIQQLWMIPAPFMSLLMEGCIHDARDISLGARYNNYGFHGTGLSTAVDSLAAIRETVFSEKTLSPRELVDAVDRNFDGYEGLLAHLRYEAPKLGNGDEAVDALAVRLLDAFAAALQERRNERGGCYRGGTGSAMYYLWHAREIGASPDGRRKGEPFGANYSPSLFARLKGPISMIRSFTRPHLQKVINGGPLTLELHGSLFRDEESIRKVALLVRSFMEMGGHQLQLNAVNHEMLLDAQKHPEKHRNLIVRVWGWSAYFVELDREYQDHVLSRQAYRY